MVYGGSEFNAEIDDVLAFEECWRVRIRPEISSPLLLPKTAFSAADSVSGVWDRARNVRRGRDRIQAIEKTISRFRSAHWQHAGWRDTNQLVFARSPTRHGSHGMEPWQNKKLTVQLPDGFHFDVWHRRNRDFRVSDQEGEPHSFSQYTNPK